MRHDAYCSRVPWRVVFHPSIVEWLQSLEPRERESFMRAVKMLEDFGPALGRPIVGTLKGSRFNNLKELRPLSTSLRCLFAFDVKRTAILLVAGDKSLAWKSWYQNSIPIAEKRFLAHLEERPE